MKASKEDLKTMLVMEEFPRSNAYDPEWIIQNQMGPNALWLTEWLCQEMNLQPGMRVLDLGCGRGMSSIFLAREFGVQVFATDLWVGATDNRKQFEAAGLLDRIIPVHAEARALPYADDYFDAIVCVDSLIYYGTDDLYLDYLRRFVRPGGRIGMVVPGFMQEIHGALPEHLLPFWAQECWSFHTVDWWRWHWSRGGLVDVKTADTLPGGCAKYLRWKQARLAAADHEDQSIQTDIDVLTKDGGQYMGFIRMVAERKA